MGLSVRAHRQRMRCDRRSATITRLAGGGAVPALQLYLPGNPAWYVNDLAWAN